MKLKEKELTTTAVREGVFMGLNKAFPGNALLTIETPEVVDAITEAVMKRLEEIMTFDGQTIKLPVVDKLPNVYDVLIANL